MRTHPAAVAQAAATSAVMLDGRFTLGVGSEEALNEHILGDAWPTADVRLAMVEEAVEVIRKLWTGRTTTHSGPFFTVDTARITTTPDPDLLGLFRERSGGKPAQAGFKVDYAATEDEGVEIAHRLWANSGLPGELARILPSTQHFEQASSLVTQEMTRGAVVCGPDPERPVGAFTPYVEAGFDEVYVANMGPHYEAMMRMYGEKVLPALRSDEGATA